MAPNASSIAHNHQRYLNGVMQDLQENNEWVPLLNVPIVFDAPDNVNLDEMIINIGPTGVEIVDSVDGANNFETLARNNICGNVLSIVFLVALIIWVIAFTFFINIKNVVFFDRSKPIKSLFLYFVLSFFTYLTSFNLTFAFMVIVILIKMTYDWFLAVMHSDL